MSKKKNRISILKLEKLMNKDKTIEIPVEGFEDVVITITPTLPLKDVIEFVETVVASCVDTETGEYTPQVVEFLIKREVLTRYANFTMPQNILRQYDLIYNTDVFGIVLQYIDSSQYGEIRDSIATKIEFAIGLINSSSAHTMNKLIGKIEDITEQSGEVFSSLSSDDFANAFKNIETISNMDDHKIVKAVYDENVKKD